MVRWLVRATSANKGACGLSPSNPLKDPKKLKNYRAKEFLALFWYLSAPLRESAFHFRFAICAYGGILSLGCLLLLSSLVFREEFLEQPPSLQLKKKFLENVPKIWKNVARYALEWAFSITFKRKYPDIHLHRRILIPNMLTWYKRHEACFLQYCHFSRMVVKYNRFAHL